MNPEIVAAIVAAIAAREGKRPAQLRLVAAERVGPAPWALAGRLQQMRGLSR
jgi:hypothetical protein